MSIEAYSTKGMRKENQDAYIALELKTGNKDISVLAVCDGMGGTANGSYASNNLIQRIEELVSKGLYQTKYIDNAVLNTHKELAALPEGSNAGTTLTYLWTDGNEYEIYHVGDSRCYSINKGTYSQITEDHSVREDARRGLYGEKSASYINFPENYLSRCVGVGQTPLPFIKQGVLKDIDGFMLCSDGFWHHFDTQEPIVNLEQSCNNAIFKGENDNITILRYLK